MRTSVAALGTAVGLVLSSSPAYATAISRDDPTPSFSVSVTDLSFGPQLVGTVSDPQPVTFTNITASSVTLGPEAVELRYQQEGAGFDAIEDDCQNRILLPGQSCRVDITFSPTSVIPYLSAELMLVPEQPASRSPVVTAHGSGIAGWITSSPQETVDFGALLIGEEYADRTVTYTNPGTAPVTVHNVEIKTVDTPLTLLNSSCSAAVLPPGGVCSVTVRFAPTVPGFQGGRLVAHYQTSPGHLVQHSAYLNGVGKAAEMLMLDAHWMRVRAIKIGSLFSSLPQEEIVPVIAVPPENAVEESFAPLAIGSISVTGPEASDFDVDSDCPPRITVIYDRCRITVALAPGAVYGVDHEATLEITSNAYSGALRRIPLSWTFRPPPERPRSTNLARVRILRKNLGTRQMVRWTLDQKGAPVSVRIEGRRKNGKAFVKSVPLVSVGTSQLFKVRLRPGSTLHACVKSPDGMQKDLRDMRVPEACVSAVVPRKKGNQGSRRRG